MTAQKAKAVYLLTLQDPKQHQAQISPSAVQMSAPSILSRHNQFSYDPVNKKLTVTPIPPHYGLQWHREWHQLPYHHLPYHQPQTVEERQEARQQAAQKICLLEHDSQPTQSKQQARESTLYPHLGRLFIVGNFYQQQSTVFICGKSFSGNSPYAYRIPTLSSSLTLATNTVNPPTPGKFIEDKEVTGLKFHGLDQLDEQKKLQLYLFLFDSVEKILFFLNLEEKISSHYESKDIKHQELVKFIKAIEAYKKATITLETVKEKPYLKEQINAYKKLSSPYFNKNQEKIPDLLINYFLHRTQEITFKKVDRTHKALLKSILTQLDNLKKTKNEKQIFKNENVPLFLSQIMNFTKLEATYWMQTVYVLSTAEYSGKDPLYELNLTDLPVN